MAGRDEADTYSPSEVRLPIDGGGDTDLVLVPKDGAGPGGHHRVTVVDEAGRRRRVFDVNLYATKKSAAQGLLDLALLMANASQLKSIMQTQGNHQFYTPMLALLSVSIAMPCSSLLIVGLALLFLGRKRISADDMDEQARRQTAIADRINNWIIAGVFILTVVNVRFLLLINQSQL